MHGSQGSYEQLCCAGLDMRKPEAGVRTVAQHGMGLQCTARLSIVTSSSSVVQAWTCASWTVRGH